MDEQELKQLLNDPKRILNIVRVFHSVLHEYDKMEELKAKQAAGNKSGVAKMALSDTLEIIQKNKKGDVKTHVINGKNLHKMEVKK